MDTTAKKQCYKCNQIKSITLFSKQEKSKDGLQKKCKECDKEYRVNNRKNIKLRKQEWCKNNAEHIKNRQRNYMLNNAEAMKLKRAEWLANNKEKMREYKANWAKLNRDKIIKYREKYAKSENGRIVKINNTHKRRVKLKNGDITSKQIKDFVNKSTNCYWCNININRENMHIDHYIPISKGGLHTLSNLVASCRKCNQTKSDKLPEEFANNIGRLF